MKGSTRSSKRKTYIKLEQPNPSYIRLCCRCYSCVPSTWNDSSSPLIVQFIRSHSYTAGGHLEDAALQDGWPTQQSRTRAKNWKCKRNKNKWSHVICTCEVCSPQLVHVLADHQQVETAQARHYWGEISMKNKLQIRASLNRQTKDRGTQKPCSFNSNQNTNVAFLPQACPYLTRLSYTELQPGSSQGSGAEHPEEVVSRGSERPFHTAADHPFTHTHDQGLKQRLTHALVI